MDPIRNPFAPGAGTPPPELAGRGELLRTVYVALERIRIGNPAKSTIMVGLRGVGKTVLLDRMNLEARARGIQTMRLEAPENRSLPALLAPELRSALLHLSLIESARSAVTEAMGLLVGFAKAIKIKFQDVELAMDVQPIAGADNGDLEHDLPILFEKVGHAARSAGTALVLFTDELQYVAEKELAVLITALHRCSQARLPVTLVGAGLPQLRGNLGRAKSYAERLFDFPEVGPLTESAARTAIEKPIVEAGEAVTAEALDEIVARTECYPYFLQEWGKHVWDMAIPGTPIVRDDVVSASVFALAALDASFFRVRFDRLTPSEKLYLRAMAELGPGPHRSGEISALLGRSVTSLGPTRSKLTSKGMIWSPSHGDTGFTVPLFDAFMRRIMPEAEGLTRSDEPNATPS